MFTMTPSTASSIGSIARRLVRKVPRRWTAIMRSQSSTVSFSNGLWCRKPATLTSSVQRPNLASHKEKIASTSSGEDTSPVIVVRRSDPPPTESSTDWSPLSSKSCATTLAPALIRATTMAIPISPPPPVTTATCSETSRMISPLDRGRRRPETPPANREIRSSDPPVDRSPAGYRPNRIPGAGSCNPRGN